MQKEEILREMKRRGKRITQQRLILMDIILENPHNCCKEIYYEAIKQDPSIGIATVYRMMNMLEEIGAVSRFYSYPIYRKQEHPIPEEPGIAILNGKELSVQERERLYAEMKQLLEKRGLLGDKKQEFAATIVISA